MAGAGQQGKPGCEQLEVYRDAHALGCELHRVSLLLPKHEMYETGSQLRRASKAVSASIVEGYGRRRYQAEFVRFLVYAQASCDETGEWLRYIADCYPDLREHVQATTDRLDKVGRQLNRLIQSVESGHQSPR